MGESTLATPDFEYALAREISRAEDRRKVRSFRVDDVRHAPILMPGEGHPR